MSGNQADQDSVRRERRRRAFIALGAATALVAVQIGVVRAMTAPDADTPNIAIDESAARSTDQDKTGSWDTGDRVSLPSTDARRTIDVDVLTGSDGDLLADSVADAGSVRDAMQRAARTAAALDDKAALADTIALPTTSTPAGLTTTTRELILAAQLPQPTTTSTAETSLTTSAPLADVTFALPSGIAPEPSTTSPPFLNAPTTSIVKTSTIQAEPIGATTPTTTGTAISPPTFAASTTTSTQNITTSTTATLSTTPTTAPTTAAPVPTTAQPIPTTPPPTTIPTTAAPTTATPNPGGPIISGLHMHSIGSVSADIRFSNQVCTAVRFDYSSPSGDSGAHISAGYPSTNQCWFSHSGQLGNARWGLPPLLPDTQYNVAVTVVDEFGQSASSFISFRTTP